MPYRELAGDDDARLDGAEVDAFRDALRRERAAGCRRAVAAAILVLGVTSGIVWLGARLGSKPTPPPRPAECRTVYVITVVDGTAVPTPQVECDAGRVARD